MSLARLREVVGQTMPFNVFDEYEIDEFKVLMDAGLVAALPMRSPPLDGNGTESGYGAKMVRVLAVTPAGHQLLRCADQGADESQAVHRT